MGCVDQDGEILETQTEMFDLVLVSERYEEHQHMC